ncbi:MAG: hypothetical protein MUC96_13015 [Myxococcaceae bacterium]|jgi:hypothetical protein|nr:hypothetical protein [Myxococcaceae bacterium]
MRAALLALALGPSLALAWDSVCFERPGRACTPFAGPQTARNRWVGPSDEHRQLFEQTREKAGLPFSVSAEQTLTVFTSAGTVDIGGRPAFTLQPSALDEVARVRRRTFTVAELSQLPDFSYALWDWASGHETCPLGDGTDATLCHDFASHMGPVNSNHFVPQAQGAYRRAHALALARAADCRRLSESLAGRFGEVTRACEVEALALEAMGQHFLQDAWSMGHMWERWGSANLDDFPGATVEEKRDRAVLTALVAGFIHGARGVLQALPTWTTYDVNDAMCAPWDDVRFVAKDGVTSQAVGDLYVTQLTPEQSRRFFDCATSGLVEVYRATAQAHGPLGTPAPGLSSIDPTGEACFGQRATNEAIVRGMAIQLKVVGVQTAIPLDARFASWMVPQVARQSGKVPVPNKTKNAFRLSLERVATMARFVAKDAPTGTSLAEGGLGDFLGVLPNGRYATSAAYEDPPLPWAPTGSFRAATLARTFHLSHAKDWCEATTLPQLEALRGRARDATLDPETRAAACEACTEFTARHLRVGTTASWDTTSEPLCQSLVPTPAYVYLPGPGAPRALARTWCCP